MIFQQFRHEEGGCLSYIIGCTQKQVCAVIDPHLATDLYTKYASGHGMKIVHIFETHSQADHLSGARKLGEETGAAIHFHESVKTAFPISPVRDGETIALGNINLKILHTPGHTPDSISILVSDTVRSAEPWFVLTGDTLFVGDTGRPDLDGSAEQLYDSIWGKLLSLPDRVEIYPSHFAGSVCGKSMSPKPSSTVGFERMFNPSLQVRSKQEFVEFVTANLPVQPPRFQKVRQYNQGYLAEPPIEKIYDTNALQVTVQQLHEMLSHGEKLKLIDVREPYEHALASIGGTLIPLSQIPKRLGDLNPADPTVIYCHHGSRSQTAVQFLYENGFMNVKTLVGGIDAWSREIDAEIPRY